MQNSQNRADNRPLDATISALEQAVARHNERLRPIHCETRLKTLGGPASRLHLYISPFSRLILSYSLEFEPEN